MKKKILYVINIFLSFLIFPFIFLPLKNKYRGKKIIIFGFGNNFYENSTRYLYEYFICNLTNSFCSFAVFEKNTIGEKSIQKENLLYRGTIKSFLIYLISDAIVFDTCNSDVAPGLQKILNISKRFFVTHGMEGMKNVDFMFKDALIKTDYMFAASDFEKSIKNKFGKYPETYVSGYPRFDFNGNISSDEKKIVILFTWRSDLKTEEEILKSNYYKVLLDLLNFPDFLNILETKKIKCFVKIHHEVYKHIKKINISSQNIIINQDTDFSRLISESCLLITDYSSLCWDYIYYDKPVIFYQFDRDDYQKKQGPLYIDVEKEKIGFSVNSPLEIVKVIDNIFVNDSNPKFRIENKSKFFKYEDKNNTQRVVNYILEHIK